MKKKTTIFLAIVLSVAFAIFILTACSLVGGDNNQTTNNENETKTLTASECSSELNGAIAASIVKDNYSIKVIGNADEGRSSVINIEYDANTQHITSRLTQDYLGITTNLYAETYLFVHDGKFYISARVSEEASFPDPAELGSKAEFDAAAADYLLNSMIGKFTLDATAEVTYTGTKKGTDIEVSTTTVAEISGVRTELFTAYTIKNGLVYSVFQRVSEYDEEGIATIKSENEITVQYDTGEVELAAGIHVD